MFGYGGLRSGEGGKDLANASLAPAQEFEQLQTDGSDRALRIFKRSSETFF